MHMNQKCGFYHRYYYFIFQFCIHQILRFKLLLLLSFFYWIFFCCTNHFVQITKLGICIEASAIITRSSLTLVFVIIITSFFCCVVWKFSNTYYWLARFSRTQTLPNYCWLNDSRRPFWVSAGNEMRLVFGKTKWKRGKNGGLKPIAPNWGDN